MMSDKQTIFLRGVLRLGAGAMAVVLGTRTSQAMSNFFNGGNKRTWPTRLRHHQTIEQTRELLQKAMTQ